MTVAGIAAECKYGMLSSNAINAIKPRSNVIVWCVPHDQCHRGTQINGSYHLIGPPGLARGRTGTGWHQPQIGWHQI